MNTFNQATLIMTVHKYIKNAQIVDHKLAKSYTLVGKQTSKSLQE